MPPELVFLLHPGSHESYDHVPICDNASFNSDGSKIQTSQSSIVIVNCEKLCTATSMMKSCHSTLVRLQFIFILRMCI